LKIEVAWETHIGKSREINQDALYTDEKLGLFMVADGIGGAPAGEVASQLAVSAIRDYIARTPRADSPALANAINCASSHIFQEAKRDRTKEGMGSTTTALWLKDGRYHIGHVGDTKAFLIRRGTIRQITQDHSLEHETHVLTRWVGGPSVKADSCSGSLQRGDRFLLCSDGLTRYLDEQQIMDFVATSRAPAELCEDLVNHANDCGGKDNITVIFLDIKSLGIPCRTKRYLTEPGKTASRVTALSLSLFAIAALLVLTLIPQARIALSGVAGEFAELAGDIINKEEQRKPISVPKDESSGGRLPPIIHENSQNAEEVKDRESDTIEDNINTARIEVEKKKIKPEIRRDESTQPEIPYHPDESDQQVPEVVMSESTSVIIMLGDLPFHTDMIVLINNREQSSRYGDKYPGMTFRVPLGENRISWVIPGSAEDSVVCETTVWIEREMKSAIEEEIQTIKPPDGCGQ